MNSYRWICLDCFYVECWVTAYPAMEPRQVVKPCAACGKSTKFDDLRLVGPACRRVTVAEARARLNAAAERPTIAEQYAAMEALLAESQGQGT